MAYRMTPRKRAFCEHYVFEGMTAADAARKAGYRESYCRHATQFLIERDDRVRAYIAELQEQRRHDTEITADKLIEELEEKIAAASNAGQFQAVANMMALKVRVSGHWIDRSVAKVEATINHTHTITNELESAIERDRLAQERRRMIDVTPSNGSANAA